MSIFSRILAFLLCISAVFAQDAGVEAAFDSLAANGNGDTASVRVITDSSEAWFVRWHLLSRARRSIDVAYFIVKDDIFGRSMVGLLRQKAREGLAVRLMIDGRGSGALARSTEGAEYLRALMEEPNVQVRIYRPMHKALLSLPLGVRNAIASNHDKIVLVDGEWLITGGRNIAKEYFASPSDLPSVFRDTDIVVRSSLIGSKAKLAFDEEFGRWDNKAIKDRRGDDLDDRRLELDVAVHAMNAFLMGFTVDPARMPAGQAAGLLEAAQQELAAFPRLKDCPTGGYASYEPFKGDRAVPIVLLDKNSRLGERNDISSSIVRLVDASTRSIYIQNPYIVLTKSAREALKRASDRGVSIVMNTNGPGSFDHLVTQATFLREWRGMQQKMPTCRIFAYRGPSTIHAKVFTFDDRVAIVGSYNMDPLSEHINSEAVCVVKNPDFSLRNRLRIEADMANSDEWSVNPLPSAHGLAGSSGPSPEAVKGALKILSITGLASLIRPLL